MRILRIADAETAGNKVAETVEAGKSALEASITKLFPEEGDEAPSGAPEKKLEAGKQPDAKADGETVDLSQQAKPAPNNEDKQPTAEEIAAEAEEAKAAGMSVEDFRSAQSAEKERTDAIAAKTGESLEQIYAREDRDGKLTDLESAQPKDAKTFTQEELEATVQKRVKNLATENAELKRQLAEKVQATPVNGPLDNVSDPAKLAEAEATAQSGLEQADDLISQLRDDPEGVEQVLRKFLGESADRMDLSVNGMRQILRNAKEGFRNTLKAVPQRKAYLDARAKAEPIAKAYHKWLAEPDDERTVLFNRMASQMPVLKANPAWDYWLGCAVQMHTQILAAQKKADAAKGKTGSPVKLRLKSAFAGTGRAGGTGKTGKTTFAQAKAKGDVNAMADALDL
jgi:hypothetical protein